jgi:antitoxin CptB
MTDSIEIRRRRAAYRANYRGTKEMDWLLGRYADARVAAMIDPGLAVFEKLLTVADPEIHAWILNPETLDQSEFAALIGDVRTYHGLESAGTGEVR